MHSSLRATLARTGPLPRRSPAVATPVASSPTVMASASFRHTKFRPGTVPKCPSGTGLMVWAVVAHAAMG